MPTRFSVLLSALLLITWIKTGFGEDLVSETQKFTYPFNSDGRIRVSNQNGLVAIAGEDIEEVRIEATKKAHSRAELAAMHVYRPPRWIWRFLHDDGIP
jgi:hypothetical protein